MTGEDKKRKKEINKPWTTTIHEWAEVGVWGKRGDGHLSFSSSHKEIMQSVLGEGSDAFSKGAERVGGVGGGGFTLNPQSTIVYIFTVEKC